MKNLFKKATYLLLIVIMFTISFCLPANMEVTEAKTLRDLKNELAAKEKEYENNQSQKRLTEEEMATKRNKIAAINTEIDNIQKEMVELTKEIEQLEEEIIIKEKEIKDIINYYQISSGESAYLEYVFDAADFTDFIYRVAVAEQLSIYNKNLIDEYNAKIKANEEKKEELSQKTVSLNEKQVNLQEELKTLQSNLGSIVEETIDIEDEIKVLKEYVNTYQNKYKCGLDEDISECGRDKLPPGTAFYRPLASGSINANFGWYSPFGTTTWHYGVDFGTSHGANVYAIANGKVAAIVNRSSCGGNMVYIQHIVNGQRYTSGYFHLAYVNVKVGEQVTYNTVIGGVGGNPNYEWWDRCSTGTHLHLQLAYGLYLEDYSYYYGFEAKSFNPRIVLNIPAEGQWFSNRTTKY